MTKKLLLIICMVIILKCSIHYYQLYSQMKDIVVRINYYVEKNGFFPKEISDVLTGNYIVVDEMFQFEDMKFKFFYGYNAYANGYILVIDKWYSPNVIYFFYDKKVEFNSELYSIRGL